MNTNTSNPTPAVEYTPAMIAAFRGIHTTLSTKAANLGYDDAQEWANSGDSDGFRAQLEHACRVARVSIASYTAWASQPDADTEVLDAMGAFSPEPNTPTPLFEEQRITLEGAEAHGESAMTDSYPDASDEDGNNTATTSAQDCLDLVREAVENHRKLTAWAIAQRFRANLRTTLFGLIQKKYPKVQSDAAHIMGLVHGYLCDIDFVNGENGPDSPVCASGDHCDSNMDMDAAFTEVVGRSMDAASTEDVDLWNAAWRIAKAEGFACPTFKLS